MGRGQCVLISSWALCPIITQHSTPRDMIRECSVPCGRPSYTRFPWRAQHNRGIKEEEGRNDTIYGLHNCYLHTAVGDAGPQDTHVQLNI